MNKFLTITAFSLAITSFIYQFTDNKLILLICLIGSIVLIYFLSWIEKMAKNFPGEIMSAILYYITKNRNSYVIEYSEAKYVYLNKNEMEYYKSMDLRCCKSYLNKWIEKFCWTSYSSEIRVNPINDHQSISFLPSKNYWTIFQIDFGERIRKRERITTGMKITGLKDDLGLAKPFLSLVNDKKIKERKLMVIIPKWMEPKNPRFEIYESNNPTKIIKTESLSYDEVLGGYEKTVKYPRKGWTYSIIWNW